MLRLRLSGTHLSFRALSSCFGLNRLNASVEPMSDVATAAGSAFFLKNFRSPAAGNPGTAWPLF